MARHIYSNKNNSRAGWKSGPESVGNMQMAGIIIYCTLFVIRRQIIWPNPDNTAGHISANLGRSICETKRVAGFTIHQIN